MLPDASLATAACVQAFRYLLVLFWWKFAFSFPVMHVLLKLCGNWQ